MTKVSVSTAWDETKAILARDGRLLMAIALALFVLPGLVTDLLGEPTRSGEMPQLGAGTLLGLISVLIALIGQMAIVRLAVGPPLTVGEAIGHGARRMPVYLAATLLWLMPFGLVAAAIVSAYRVESPEQLPPSAALALLALLAAVIFFAVKLLLTSPVASVERVGPVAAIKRSWQLTRGNWGRLFVFLMLFLILVAVVTLAVGSVVGLITRVVFGDPEPMSVGALVVSLVSQLLAAVLSVMFTVMLARIYVGLAGGAQATPSVPHTKDD